MVASIELGPEDLYLRCDPADLPLDSTAQAASGDETLGQDRALEALRFAVGIHHDGYNVFALGPDGTGMREILLPLLVREAATQPPPADWCYVFNVADPQRPRALRVPPGTACRLRADLGRAMSELRVAIRTALDREVALHSIPRILDQLRAAYHQAPAVLQYIGEIEADITGRVHGAPESCDHLQRYQVHVLVDHGTLQGAPVVVEDSPTHARLIGRIQPLAAPGTVAPEDFLIRAGALHRANGGYLVLDALPLMHQPQAWEALKRALRTRALRIELPDPVAGILPAAPLDPEPIPLDLKVVLLGDRAVYYALAAQDPELGDLFKVMADFEQSIDRGPGAHAAFATLVAGIVRKHALRPLDRGAIARVIEHAARLAGDAHKLSVQLRPLVDLLTEADDVARRAQHGVVTAVDVQLALDAHLRRVSRLRDRVLESIRRKTLLIETTGSAQGQVNALSMLELASESFAYPTRITARARMGGGEVIDIERQVELGGPVHSKGVMILSGLLGARYAQHLPLSLSATIAFEQSYGGVEGDSASLAELCALLSAIAEVPISQAIAVTGSVNQHGELQPVGGVNEKIEGFFDVCLQRGLTGEQGVLIPRANVQHLMLRHDVVEAVAAHQFHVHAASSVDEAIAVLTGLLAGERDDLGRFSEGSVNALVDARLETFAQDAVHFMQGDERGHRRRLGRWTHTARTRPDDA